MTSEPSGLRVLIVEDMEDCAQSLAQLLRLYGHDVRVAENGRQAIDLCRAVRPHVVLLDVGLPGMNGYDVAREIRQEWDGDAPYLVAVTGYGQLRDVENAMAVGFDLHMLKPVRGEALQAMLRDEQAKLAKTAERRST